jgi:PAS domain S-box-containing protein
MSPSTPSSPTIPDLLALAGNLVLPGPLGRSAEDFGRVLAAAVAAAPTGVVISDPNLPDCPIVFANPAFFAITGYPASEVLGRNCRFLQGPDTDPKAVAQLRRAIMETRPIALELINHRRDGRRFVNELRVAPVFDTTGRLACFVGIQHDVTERAKAERATGRARRAAERANAGKSAFLAFMSHEIRTPLNGVLGTVSLLLDTPLDAEQRAYAETARRCGEAMLHTLNEILDLSRVESGRLALEHTPFALADPVREVLDLLAPAVAEKGIRLHATLDPSLPARVVGDPGRFRQVLLNLADNAVKFTSQGQVEISLAAQDGRIVAQVADTGIGMSPAVQSRLFRRFQQAEASHARRFGGSGLGLLICKRLVDLMGGHIAVHSAPGEGTTFTFDLPLVPVADSGTPPGHLSPAPVAARISPGARGRLLLAEDGEANTLVAAAILRKAGYSVDLARDGTEAVAAAASGTYDLVLMDVRMPGMDGFAATAAIRSLKGPASRVPILALTASVLPQDVDRCLAAGMDGHVAKPLDRERLLLAVGGVLESRPRRPRAPAPPPEPQQAPPLLDRETLEELRAAVGPGRLPRLIGVFAEETRARLGRMQASSELRLIEDEAHSLTSAAGTFGAAALREAAAAIEEAALRGERSALAARLAALPELVEATLAAFPAPG